MNQSYTLLPYIDTDMTAASLPSDVRVSHETVNPEEVVFEIEKRVVTLGGFWMGQYPVTQAQWRSVMANNPSQFPLGDEYPVDSVRLDDTMRMAHLLTATHHGQTQFRLPNPIEWLYAAGALSDPVYWHEAFRGYDKELIFMDFKELTRRMEDYGWFDGATHPVGQKHANPLGLYDMLGNIPEWTVWHGAEGAERLFDLDVLPAGVCRQQAMHLGREDKPAYLAYLAGLFYPGGSEFRCELYSALIRTITGHSHAFEPHALAGFRLLRPA